MYFSNTYGSQYSVHLTNHKNTLSSMCTMHEFYSRPKFSLQFIQHIPAVQNFIQITKVVLDFKHAEGQ